MSARPIAQPLRFFLGNVPEDESARSALEKHLTGLRRSGILQLFDVTHIAPGSARQQVILEHLQEADIIVLLISVDFIASDFWYEFALPTALIRHQAGATLLIPVLVRPVDCEHTPFHALQPLPTAGGPISAHSDSDTAWHQVALSLRTAIDQLLSRRCPLLPPGPALPAQKTAVVALAETPLSAPPPGGGYAAHDYVPRPQPERDALLHLVTPGTPAVLLAPQLMGKTLLLQHLLRRLASRDSLAWTTAELDGSAPAPRSIRLDLRQLEPEVWSSSDAFFAEFSARIVEQLGGSRSDSKPAPRSRLPATQRLSHFFETEVLSRIPENGRLILAIDHADTVCDRVGPGSKLPDAFFGLLRVWIERSRTSALWPRLRLLLAIATSPAYLTRNINQSPFNICLPVDVGDLDDEQVQTLLQRYQLDASPAILTALRERVGGHPYLIRLALYRSLLCQLPLAELLAAETVFDEYLVRLRRHLMRIGLFDPLVALHRDPTTQLAIDDFQLLFRLGIVVRTPPAHGSQVGLRYPLYRRMFHL